MQTSTHQCVLVHIACLDSLPTKSGRGYLAVSFLYSRGHTSSSPEQAGECAKLLAPPPLLRLRGTSLPTTTQLFLVLQIQSRVAFSATAMCSISFPPTMTWIISWRPYSTSHFFSKRAQRVEEPLNFKILLWWLSSNSKQKSIYLALIYSLSLGGGSACQLRANVCHKDICLNVITCSSNIEGFLKTLTVFLNREH